MKGNNKSNIDIFEFSESLLKYGSSIA